MQDLVARSPVVINAASDPSRSNIDNFDLRETSAPLTRTIKTTREATMASTYAVVQLDNPRSPSPLVSSDQALRIDGRNSSSGMVMAIVNSPTTLMVTTGPRVGASNV